MSFFDWAGLIVNIASLIVSVAGIIITSKSPCPTYVYNYTENKNNLYQSQNQNSQSNVETIYQDYKNSTPAYFVLAFLFICAMLYVYVKYAYIMNLVLAILTLALFLIRTHFLRSLVKHYSTYISIAFWIIAFINLIFIILNYHSILSQLGGLSTARGQMELGTQISKILLSDKGFSAVFKVGGVIVSYIYIFFLFIFQPSLQDSNQSILYKSIGLFLIGTVSLILTSGLAGSIF